MSNEVCKLPNSIVTALKVDDEGQLWFICQRPAQEVVEYEGSFPARLHFYHKGVFFHLEVSGKATIIKDEEGDDPEIAKPGDEKYLLIKMSMNSIEYTEPYGKKERSRIELLLDKGYKWMLRNLALSHETKPVFSKNAM
jgi:hypothetical protein